jgi:YVTN family beta-propeller protein
MNNYLRFMLLSLLLFLTPLSAQISPSAYVANTLGENLSMIDLINHTVNPNAEPLGLYANQVVLRGDRAYVINSGANEIQVINLTTLNTLYTVDVGAGTNPWGMDFVNDDVAAVSLLLTNQVKFVNVFTGQVVQTVSVGTGPQGVVFSDGKVYVANSGYNGAGYDPGTVSVINTNDYSVSTIAVGLNPQTLAIDSQGNIVVACSGDYVSAGGEINVIDTDIQQVVHSVSAGMPITGVAVNAGDKAYFSTFGSGVLVYDLINQTFERDTGNPLPGGPGIAFDALDNAYISDFGRDSVHVFSPSHQLQDEYLVGDGPISIAVYDPAPSSIGDPETRVVAKFSLHQNYPNPFNPETTIEFETYENGTVLLEIFNVLGKGIRKLVNKTLPAGSHSMVWDGKNDLGRKVPSGIYLYRLQMGGESSVRKMQLIE